MQARTCYQNLPSPAGRLTLVANDTALLGVLFDSSHAAINTQGWSRADNPILQRTVTQLQAYFAGQRSSFDLPLASSGTEFQEAVWQALTQIPLGTTWSYQQLAAHIGRPKAVRAVGAANGRNPLSIVRPCHRVIGANGQLTGYGGGLPAKQWLLQHEGAL